VINSDKIEEWIHEVEGRPTSAPLIIQFIANRLNDLSRRNEELLAENIKLMTGRKVEEYEAQIARLEYQVNLLKRQFSGEIPTTALAPLEETTSLLAYTSKGLILRVDLPSSELTPYNLLASFSGEISPGGLPPTLLVVSSQDELLLAFDSGRSVTLPVSSIPAMEGAALDWQQAYIQEPRASEELSAILPISRMSLFEYCVQTSRRGFVKRIREPALETYIAKSYIGSGVKLQADKMCSLAFGNKNDLFIMVSQEGFFFSMEIDQLPVTVEEVIHLGSRDYIVATFIIPQKAIVLVATNNGKAFQRDRDWLEPSNSYRTRGQQSFTKERRESGVRAVGAAAVEGASDWAAILTSDGRIVASPVAKLIASGSLFSGLNQGQILAFTAFHPPSPAA
jgi:DNA gyrase/topoisomerase IV subunit A